jgi:hypothetical protein
MPAPQLDRIDMTTVAGLMKRRYLPLVQDALWNADDQLYAHFSKVFRKDQTGVSDAGAFIPVNLAGILSGAFVPEGGELPSRGSPEYQQFQVSFHDFYVPIVFTERQRITLEGNDAKAVANVVKEAMRQAVLGGRKLFSILLPGDGSAKLATISAGSGAGGSSTIPTETGDKAFFVRRGMLVDIYSGATKLNSQPLLVTAVAPDFSSFTVDQSLTFAANDVVYLAGSRDDAFRGLLYHVNNSGTYQGIARSDYPHELNAIVVDKAGNAVTVADVRRIYGRLRLRGVDNKKNLALWVSTDQIEKIMDWGIAQKRFLDNKLEPAFNEDALTIEGVKVFSGIDLPAGTWWFIEESRFFWLVNRDFGPVDDEYYYRTVSSGGRYKAEFITWYRASLELVGTMPKAHARIFNAAFDGSYRA